MVVRVRHEQPSRSLLYAARLGTQHRQPVREAQLAVAAPLGAKDHARRLEHHRVVGNDTVVVCIAHEERVVHKRQALRRRKLVWAGASAAGRGDEREVVVQVELEHSMGTLASDEKRRIAAREPGGRVQWRRLAQLLLGSFARLEEQRQAVGARHAELAAGNHDEARGPAQQRVGW